MRLYKLVLLSGLSFCTSLFLNLDANAGIPTSVHSNVFGISGDGGTAVSRAIGIAVKTFLSDDTELLAELIWDDGKGCGGCYKGSCSGKGNTDLSKLLVDLSIETDLFQGDALKKTCVADVAQKRLDASTCERAALRDLEDREWELQYQSQRRSIQALADALNAKRIYNEIKDVATTTMDDYSDYSNAISSVASKRLLLDQLLALKKRVIAARLRIRAQTLDVNAIDLSRVTSEPDLSGICPGQDETEPVDTPRTGCAANEYFNETQNACVSCGANSVAQQADHSNTTCVCNDGFEWDGTSCVAEEDDEEDEEEGEE